MKRKVIIGSLVLCTMFAACGDKNQDKKSSNTSDTDEDTLKVSVYGEYTEEELAEYNSLLEEANTLENTNTSLAIEKYLEAKNLAPEESKAYVDLINLYIKEEDPVSESCLVEEANEVESPSSELQQLLAEENQKQWYLVKAHSTDYELYKEEKARHNPKLGELVFTPTGKREFYYEYDEQGRLIKTNSGSYLGYLSMATGLARFPGLTTCVDEVYWEKERRTSGEYYSEYERGRGIYEVLGHVDADIWFSTFEYNSDGSVTEIQFVDKNKNGNYSAKYKYNYTFDSNNRLTSLITYWDYTTTDQKDVYSNFVYSNDYTSYQVNGETRYWEEGYTYDGILANYMLPYRRGKDTWFSVDSDDLRKKFDSSVKVPNVREIFTYSDNKDACGNITSRSMKEEILMGTGRELIAYKNGGSDYDSVWLSFQSNIPIQDVYYDYVYCKPAEIKSKTEGSCTNNIKSLTNRYDHSSDIGPTNDIVKNEGTIASSSDYILYNSSSEELSDSDVESLTKEELRIARNEIFARHGYIFSSEDLKEYFGKFDWYKPVVKAEDFNIDKDLSEVEKANLRLIEKYENK